MTATDYERLGGATGVERLVAAFVARVAADPIIGFLFAGRDLERVVLHEVEHASRHLGGPRAYTGRPLRAVHQRLGIHRGHFRRRLAILRHVLEDHGVDDPIAQRWLDADRSLEHVVTIAADCVEDVTDAHGDDEEASDDPGDP